MFSTAIAAATPPPRFDQFEPASLFIDFDGTLVELIDRPDQVSVDGALHDLLTALAARLPGRVALISGRSIAQLDGFLGPLGAAFAMAGSHGAERRGLGGPLIAPDRPPELDVAERAMVEFAFAHAGVLVESKTFGAALHYRMAPEHEAAAHDLARALAASHGLKAQAGKMMVELKTAGDKGEAVHAFMHEAPMAGTRPLFIGDDLTDEEGFAAAKALGGAGLLVGPARDTAASYRFENVKAVRAWLAEAAA